jgi:hypothetical protein
MLAAGSASAVADLDIPGILAELIAGDVEFLLIGGVAVGYHGHIRATKDVDVVPAPDAANLKKLAQALERLEAEVEGADNFDRDELPNPFDPTTLELGGNWILLTRLGRLDVLQWIGEDPLWEKLAPASIKDVVVGLPIRVVGYDDLVALKELAGRGQDLEDLKKLREAREDG